MAPRDRRGRQGAWFGPHALDCITLMRFLDISIKNRFNIFLALLLKDISIEHKFGNKKKQKKPWSLVWATCRRSHFMKVFLLAGYRVSTFILRARQRHHVSDDLSHAKPAPIYLLPGLCHKDHV